MRTRLTQIALDDLVDGFTGRDGMEGYDPEKPIKLYELNRDFVWPMDYQTGLITSILSGYPVSPITTCNGFIVDGGNRTTTLWKFKNNKFSVELDGDTYTYEDVQDDRDLIRAWDRCQVPVVEITEATDDNISNIYQNLNTAVKLSPGQLLENRKHIPVVDAALSILGRSVNNDQFPYKDMTDRVWPTRTNKTETRSEIAFAFELLVGTMYGPGCYHTSFHKFVKEKFLEEGNVKSTYVNFEKLEKLLSIVDEADPGNTVDRVRKTGCLRKFAGGIVHDMYDESMSTNDVKQKWQTMFKKAYFDIDSKELKKITDVGTNRANNHLRLKALSERVQKYLDGELDMRTSNGSVHESDREY